MVPTWSLNGVDRLSRELVQQMRRAYYACITQIDYNLGHLFARLRELNELDNTLIVFTSDHGDMLGDHHMGAKTIFLEGSAHVPMLIRAPDSLLSRDLAGAQSDALACLADLMPTFLRAAGVEQEPIMDGLDLLAVLQGRARARETFIGAYSDHFCAIADRHKYVYTSTGGAELMFNLAKDPMEQHNLTKDAAVRPMRDRLRKLLIDSLGSSGHPVAASGELKPLTPAPVRESVARWPGFHTREHTDTDVLH